MITHKTRGVPWWFTAGLIAMIMYLVWIFTACGGDNERVVVTDPTPGPVEIDPGDPPTDHGPAVFALQSTGMKFTDGAVVWTWKEDASLKAKSAHYSNGAELFSMNEYAQETSVTALPFTPEHITIIGVDIYTVRNVPPAEAYDKGALAANYTLIYKNNSELGTWSSRQYITDKIRVVDGNLYACSTVGKWYTITGAIVNPHAVIEAGLIAHEVNTTTRTGLINGAPVSWATNYFNGAKEWQKAGEIWYSQNGYAFSGTALTENGLAMAAYRPVQNNIIPVGIHTSYLYWIDCTTGWILQHNTASNTVTEHVRIYTGDGTSDTGNFHRTRLQPLLYGDCVYFFYEGQYYKTDLINKLTSHFVSGTTKMMTF
ncbi:MAG: hypothetical protein EHM45_06490 [Desulfobacteraceae bacterium]|nr:MAG: hypothetical protein EHM45_06490 [Desulfobacteraceae bacterium]